MAEGQVAGERLRIHAAVAIPRESDAAPGTLLAAGRDGLDVACGEGALRIRTLQREGGKAITARTEEHTSELQSLMRISYAVFCLTKKKKQRNKTHEH